MTDKISAFKRFMESRGLKAHPWSKKAGVRSSTIYNFLAGTTEHLSSETLLKLAKAADVTIDEILGAPSPVPAAIGGSSVEVVGRVGASAKLYSEQGMGKVTVPWKVESETLYAATVDGDAMHPVRSGWVVLFERAETPAAKCVGKLAVVTVAGRGQPLIREVMAGSQRDLYTLIGWACAPVEDVEIERVQLVVSIMQPLGNASSSSR